MKNKKAAAKRKVKYDQSSARVRIFWLILLSVALAMIIDIFNRGSAAKMLTYVVSHPGYFLYNVLIILATLSFSELFKHRQSVLLVECFIWLALGLADFIVVKSRTQPLTSMDILMIGEAFSLITIYFTWPQIIALFGGIFLLVVGVLWLIVRLPKRRHVNYLASLVAFVGLVLACVCVDMAGTSAGFFPRYYENLVDAYDQYGFVTCFTVTFGGTGISEPDEYSTETVASILEDVDASTESEEADAAHVFDEDDNLSQPNIIFVQLESLFDVNTIIGSSYSEDPTPNFNTLSEEYPSGELYVPAIGGGTVNVEFEVLTGMNIDFFGAGEYPYTTVLKDTTVETIAYNLLEQGYSTTAMHNYTATFYSRNEVYANMGFESFVSVEYIPYVTYTDVGWPEDIILADEIIKALDATDSRDFIMAITVESHGKYEETYTYEEGDVEVYELPDQIDVNSFSNYLRLIRETDEFIGELIALLEDYDEPVVVVFYGDHLPALNLSADILTTGNLYASRYIIWNNYGAEFEAPDLQAYQLSANLLEQLGMSGGVITKYHQASDLTAEDNSDYLDALEVLEYDLLYGDMSSYPDGVNPYEPTDLVMGSVPITISDVSTDYGRILITGENFTECSAIVIDEVVYDTAFVSTTQIVAILPDSLDPDAIGEVCVAQFTSDGVELSRTDAYVLSGG